MGSVDYFCERMRYWCEDANLGYSQTDRWNFNANGGNCDCSSLVIYCLREAGFDTGAATYTGNLSSELCARGWRRVANDGLALRGDILLNDARHTATYLGNGLIAQASSSESGSISGTAGDQTGRETEVIAYYNYPWDCYLRYEGDDMSIDELYAAKGNDGRNLWDSIIQTRNELQDRASDALIATRGNDGRNVLDSVIQARFDIAEVKALVVAQSAAIEALSSSVGCDSSSIASIVETAVRDKLSSLRFALVSE